LILRNGEY